MTARPAEFLGHTLADCDCPEEAYLYDGIDLVMHFEADGTVDAHLDGGDWGEVGTTLRAPSRFQGRLAVFAWADRAVNGPVAPEVPA